MRKSTAFFPGPRTAASRSKIAGASFEKEKKKKAKAFSVDDRVGDDLKKKKRKGRSP
jgi:hypothetical protein